MSRRIPPFFLAALALFSLGCSSHDKTLAPEPLDPAALGGGTFNVVAKNAGESVILLGQLRFAPIAGNTIQGTWDLRQWSGSDVPGLPTNGGALSGTVFGGTAVIQLDLPGTESTLGIVADRVVDGRVTGTISLLPSQSFEGSFEAIRSDSP